MLLIQSQKVWKNFFEYLEDTFDTRHTWLLKVIIWKRQVVFYISYSEQT